MRQEPSLIMPKPTRVRAKTKPGGKWVELKRPESWQYKQAKIGYAGYGIGQPTRRKKPGRKRLSNIKNKGASVVIGTASDRRKSRMKKMTPYGGSRKTLH